jgi:ribosomal protein S20
MHGLAIPATNLFTNAVSQTVAGFANRASSAARNFESDLQSGDIAGAQSFLTALQQKLGAQGSTPAGSAVSAQIKQVSNDLQSGNLTAAQTDFSNLQLSISQLKHRPGLPASGNRSGAQAPGSAGTTTSSALADLQSYNPLQQNAFSGALNLSLPASVPSLSVNS